MKNKIYLTTLFAALFTFMLCEVGFAQNPNYYDVINGTGNGFRLWNGNNNYKIHMGNTAEYHYGPVTGYSIKTNMYNSATRGWTWGAPGITPKAALSTQGNFQIAGWMKNMSRYYYFGNNQRLYGDDNSALYWRSAHSTASQIILQDKEGTKYGHLYGSGNGVYFGLLDGDGNWSYLASKDDYTAFRINNDEKMRIKSNGYVGIGTNAPSYKLQTNGDIYANGGWVRVSGQKGIFFQSYGGGFYMVDNTWIRTYNNKSFYHNTGIMRTDGTFQVGPNGNRLIVTTNGGVGIGTTNLGSFKLSVNGSIRAKEVKVESNWSDYVFYDDYQLPTLEEEEKHIEQNGHLLGFESEGDMEGMIPLGDVSRRQQAKIEEMMLHLIQINEQLKVVEDKVANLEKENTQLKKQLKTQK